MHIRNTGLAVAALFATLLALTSNVYAIVIDDHFEGFWYESGLNASRGWGLQYLPTGPEEGVLFAAGYVYGDGGAATWYVGQATVYDGEYEVEMPLLAFSGGAFGPGVGAPGSSPAGTLTITFNTCNSADFAFADVPGVADFTQEFQSFLDIVGGPTEDRCVYQREFTGCPAFAQDLGNRNCGIGGTISEDVTLTNEITWVMTSATFIGARPNIGDPVPENGPTLTIEPGTRIVGTKAGRVALIISRGSRIIAEGLPHAPIVMTGENWEGTGAQESDWGGLVINGAAPINDGINCQTLPTPPCEATGEGDSGAYGGNNPYDSSGVLRYVRVQFAGDRITDEDELNGIAMQGVGSGTVVDYVQVHRNADDGIEFYGGTVSARHLVLTDIGDDSIDWTQGWQGNIQYALVKQYQDLDFGDGNGMELDNLQANPDALPRAKGVMANFTIIGKPGLLGIQPRRGTGGNFGNFIVTGFGTCLNIDSDETFINGGTPPFPAGLTGELTMTGTILDCDTNIVEDAADPWSTQAWFDAQEGNSESDPMLDGIFPPEDADYLRGYPLDPMIYGEFFDHVDYIGAFRSRESAWIWNWTEFLDF